MLAMKTSTSARPCGFLAVLLLAFLAVPSRAQNEGGGTVTIRKTVYGHCGCDATQTASSTSATSTDQQQIALGDLTLRGVVAHAPTSPSTCYALPTPTASLARIAVNVQDSAVVTGTPGAGDVSDIIFLYMNGALSRPAYMGSYSSSGGGQTLIDMSANATVPGLPVVLSDRSSLVLGDDGVRWFDANCSAETWIEVPGMFEQIERAVLGKRDRPENERRGGAETATFLVEVELDTGKGAEDIRPSLAYGADACPLVGAEQRDHGGDLLTWQCKYPPSTRPAEQACDSSLSNLTRKYPARGVGSSDPLNALALLGALFPPSQTQSPSSSSLNNLFPGNGHSTLDGASAFLARAFDHLSAALKSASSAICNALHKDDSVSLVLAGDHFGSRTIGNYANTPPTSISVNLATEMPVSRPTKLPSRQVVPGETGFPTETVSGYATDITILVPSRTTIVVKGTPSVTGGVGKSALASAAPTPEYGYGQGDGEGKSGKSSKSKDESKSASGPSVSMVAKPTNTAATTIVRSTRSPTSSVVAGFTPPAATYMPSTQLELTAEPTISSSASSIPASESTLFDVYATDTVDTVSTSNTAVATVGSDSSQSTSSATMSV